MRVRIALSLSAILIVAALIILAACSGGGSGSTSKGSNVGTVNLTISDPSTCSAPQGPYSSVYVTVADVKIHQSATAGPNDAGWVDLTPNLTPTQIDLLGIANNNCFLASLGSNIQITAGNYQQIRVILLDNSKAAQVTNNKCGNAANCVVLAADPNNPQPLQLSSESQTGIKIPPGQLAGGQFTVAAGEGRDLNIDFNACASIVIQNNGQYRLKPVLHAGEVSLTASSISGKVVDSTTKAAISGGKVVVALEQIDSNGIDRVIMETVADGNGNFVLCPVAAGTYDVVAVGIDGNNVQYAATITTGVQPGNAISQLLLFAQPAPGTASAHIAGQVTTANTSNGGTSADISLAALQTIVGTSGNVLVTIPQAAASSATLSLATAPANICPANTNCATYDMQLPAVAPYVGAFSPSNQTWTQQPTPSPDFTLDALAFVPNSGSTPNCSPSEQQSPTPLAVTAGQTTAAPDLTFTGCQ